MSDYKPGTVAKFNTAHDRDVLGIRWVYGWVAVFSNGQYELLLDTSERPTDIRPLVVLDPKKLTGNFGTFPGRDHAATMAKWLRKLADNDKEQGRYSMPLPHVAFARRLSEVIQAQTKPPKPDEPKEFGAKVTARTHGSEPRRLLRFRTDVDFAWLAEDHDPTSMPWRWSELSDVTLGWDGDVS